MAMALPQPLPVDFHRGNSDQSRSMEGTAMAQPLRNKKKKNQVILFHLESRKGIPKTSETRTNFPRRKGNSIDMSPHEVKALCEQGRLKDAIEILRLMTPSADYSTYVCLLQACVKKKALSEGKLIHTHMNERGFTLDRFLNNTLVNMYGKCGSLLEARRVFDEMREPDVFTWSVLIAAYHRHGLADEALSLFRQMQRAGIKPNQFTFVSVLRACANLAALEQGMEIHEEIIRSGFQSDVFVSNALVDMYAKCGSIENARKSFDKMSHRDIVSWNVMIATYTKHGLSEEALTLFRKLQGTSIQPDQFTFATILPACANLGALEQGMQIHDEIIRSGIQTNVFVESACVDLYAKCGNIEKARDVFDKMHHRDVVSWNTMIAFSYILVALFSNEINFKTFKATKLVIRSF